MVWMNKAVKEAMSLLEAKGFEAYLVGGCVRDALLGNQAKDFDLTTNAKPEELCEVFSAYRVIDTGLSHGTLTVLCAGLALEITTFRTESGYSDGRHPDQVHFTASLREDLARRDFTINAMAYHPKTGLVDFFEGERDLEAREIRCVGDADARFREDALRILRALRFASVLGFSIEADSERALRRQVGGLRRISRERVREELGKMLCGKDVGSVLLRYIDVLGELLPELLPMKGFAQRSKYHCYDVLTHTAVALENSPPEPLLRWAVLLHDIGKPPCFSLDEEGVGHFRGHNQYGAQQADVLLRRLRFDNASRAKIVTLVRIHDMPLPVEECFLRRCLSQWQPELFFALLAVKRADNWGQAEAYQNRLEQYDQVEALVRSLLAREGCLSLQSLAVNGVDLLELGYEGPAIGEALQYLLDAVLDGREENDRVALLALLVGKQRGL